jgi:hypothetical protein
MSDVMDRCSGGCWRLNGGIDEPLENSSQGMEIDEEGESKAAVDTPLDGVVDGVAPAAAAAAAAPMAPPGW